MKLLPFPGALLLVALCAAIFLGCPSAPAVRVTAEPVVVRPAHLIVFQGGDTLSGTITHGDVLHMRVATAGIDTVEIDNSRVSRILSASSGADITDTYIDADLIKIQRARLAIDKRQAQLKADVEAGRRRKTDWTLRTTFALILARLDRPPTGVPELSLTLYNFGEKPIALFKARVYCLDEAGRAIQTNGKDHVMEASSAVHVDPGDDFTTRLRMVSHSEARNARVQVTYVEFADSTWWRGKMDMATF